PDLGGATRIGRHLRTVCPRVGDRWSPRLGVKTGADDVFLVARPGPVTRPVVRGRDLGPWRATPRAHLLWTHGPDGRPLARLPAELARALDPHIERLRRRSDYRGGPAWQLFRIALADAPCRVIWPDLARRLAAVVPDAGVVPLNTVYGIATRAADDAYALAALFNSRWLTALARLSADPARGGFRRFNAGVVRGLPLPPANPTPWPPPHQGPAAERLTAILGRHGGALLADAVGLGKSYVALAVALALSEPFALVVPAVLVDQWRALSERYNSHAPIITHESLSVNRYRPLPPAAARCPLFV